MQINEENARRLGEQIAAMRPPMLAGAERVGKQMAEMGAAMQAAAKKVGKDLRTKH